MSEKLLLTNSSGTWDITEMNGYITWSGEKTQVNRKLEFSLLCSPTDKNVPVINCELGNLVQFYQDNTLLFYGHILARGKDTERNEIDIKCSDRGFYLKRNKKTYKFTNTTAENIAKIVCNDFGIEIGSLVSTGVKISRNFIGSDLYDIIATAYYLASLKTGKKYMATFKGSKFYVIEKGISNDTLVIEGGSNLISASFSESIENMVNQVVIYDKDDKIVTKINNSNYIKLYGLMQDYIKLSDNDNGNDKAKKLLEDNGIERKTSVDNLGNIANVTGGTVIVREPHTGLYGLFYIDSDTHTWKNGLYVNNLILNFKNIMDEKEVGSLPNSDGSKTTSKSKKKKSNSGLSWDYKYKPS